LIWMAFIKIKKVLKY